MNGYWIVIVSIVLSVLFLLSAVQISQAHEPYPTTFKQMDIQMKLKALPNTCLLYTSPSPRDS